MTRFSVAVLFLALIGMVAPSRASEIEFSSHNFEFREDALDPAVSVRLVNCPARRPTGTIPVRVVASGETAEEGADFFAFAAFELGEAAIGSGGELRVVRVAEVPIEVVRDDLGEAAESFTLRLELEAEAVLDCGNGPEPVIVGDVAIVTILDAPIDQSTIGFTTEEVRIVEGDGDEPRMARFTVERRSGVMPASVICQTTRAGTAVEGEDFEPVGVVLGWGEGDSSERLCEVPILGDDITEPRETVALLLVPAAGEVKLQGDRGIVHVSDDDSPGRLQFRSVEFRANEGEGQAVVTVERRGGSEGPAQALVRAHPRSAHRGADWSLGTDTLEWQNGDEQPKQLIIDLVDDGDEEVSESLTLVLEAGSEGSLLGDLRNAVVVIDDDDGVQRASTDSPAVPLPQPESPLVPSAPELEATAEPMPVLPVRASAPEPEEPLAVAAVSGEAAGPAEVKSPRREAPSTEASSKEASSPETVAAVLPRPALPRAVAEPSNTAQASPDSEEPGVTVRMLPFQWRGSKLEAGVRLTNHESHPVALRIRLSVSRDLRPAARAEGRVTLKAGETVILRHPFTGLPRSNAYTLSYRTTPEPVQMR